MIRLMRYMYLSECCNVPVDIDRKPYHKNYCFKCGLPCQVYTVKEIKESKINRVRRNIQKRLV